MISLEQNNFERNSDNLGEVRIKAGVHLNLIEILGSLKRD